MKGINKNIYNDMRNGLEYRFSRNLNSDNRKLTDMSILGKDNMGEALAQDLVDKSHRGYLLSGHQPIDNPNLESFYRSNFKTGKGLALGSNPATWSPNPIKEDTHLDRAVNILGQNGSGILKKNLVLGNLSNSNHKEIMSLTGMPMNHLENMAGGKNALRLKLKGGGWWEKMIDFLEKPV